MSSKLLIPGSKIGLKSKFKIESFYISGGFSELYLGFRYRDSKKVIIKVLRNSDFEDNQQVEAYWRREIAFIDITSAYSVHSLKLLDSLADKRDLDDPKYIIITNFIEGAEFSQWYNEWNKNPPLGNNYYVYLIKNIFIPLCENLKYCAEHGIIHRDFTISNFIISKEEVGEKILPIIIDWGAARNYDPADIYDIPPYIEEMQGKGTYLFTPGFSAPEIMEEKPPLPQTDIYNMGTIMYYAFTGGITRNNDLLSTDYILSPSEVFLNSPIGINSVVEKCTQYQPKDRYLSFEALINSLKDVLEILTLEL